MKRERRFAWDIAKKHEAKRRRTNGKVFQAQGDYQKGRELRRAPPTEKKCFDLAQVGYSIVAAGNFTLLNGVQLGSELYQRIGRKIYMRSLQIKGYILNQATTGTDYFRLIIYYDSQNNAGTAGTDDLLQDMNAAHGTTATSLLNLNNRERFKILRTIEMTLPAVSNAAGVLTNLGYNDYSERRFSIEEFIPLQGLETIFNQNSNGNAGDITSGSLNMFMISNVSTDCWEAVLNFRLRYYD